MRKGETRKIVETVLARKGLALTIYPTALTGAGSQLLDLLLQIPPIRGYRIGLGTGEPLARSRAAMRSVQGGMVLRNSIPQQKGLVDSFGLKPAQHP